MDSEQTDIHNLKKGYDSLLSRISKMPSTPSKEILDKFVDWHNEQINKGNKAYISSTTTLSVAKRICEQFPDVTNIKQKDLESWFSNEINRFCLRRVGNDRLVETKKRIGAGRAKKIESQTILFFKFVYLLSKGKPVSMFNSKKIKTPACCEFLTVPQQSSKTKEKPRISQEKIKEIIGELRKSGNYNDELTSVFVSLVNDCGLRFSEAASLKLEDISVEEDYLVINVTQSKTATRSVISILAKPLLVNWLGKRGSGVSKKELVFCSKTKKPISYSTLRKCLRNVIGKVGLDWKVNSAFHFLRHLTASRFVAYGFPSDLRKYWFGWRLSGMDAVYVELNYMACLPYYKKVLNEEKNPMLEQKLSFIEEKQQSIDDLIREKVNRAVDELTRARGLVGTK